MVHSTHPHNTSGSHKDYKGSTPETETEVERKSETMGENTLGERLSDNYLICLPDLVIDGLVTTPAKLSVRVIHIDL